MSKSILILEDDIDNFETIYNLLHDKYRCFPKITRTDTSNWINLKKIAENYTIDSSAELESELKKMNNGQFDLFVIDVSLTLQGVKSNPFEMLGGKIRRDVLAKIYPQIPVIFFTVYTERDIRQYMQSCDIYICKNEWGSTNVNVAINKLLKPTIEKLLENEKND